MPWKLQVKTLDTDENFFVSVGDLISKEHADTVVAMYHRTWKYLKSEKSFEDYLLEVCCDFFGRVEG